MKREIKFRVWDKTKKLFIPDDVYAILNPTSFDAFGVMIKDWDDYREGEYFYDNAQELIQFTGLKDKNGKDIYEGDIVRIEYHNTSEICGIEWGYYSDGEYVDNVECWVAGTEPLSDKGGLWGSPKHDYEVIGNIYENPELLK